MQQLYGANIQKSGQKLLHKVTARLDGMQRVAARPVAAGQYHHQQQQ
jgi:hypothetical protein